MAETRPGKTRSAFTVLSHTADTGLRVRGADTAELLNNLLLGIRTLLGAQAPDSECETASFTVDCTDKELFYCAFANELIYLIMEKQFAPASLAVSMKGGVCRTVVCGRHMPQGAAKREIKAALLHRLRACAAEDGLLLEIYFDV